ncbi:hypothetical protein F8388_018597 [Cannabis sativa]|uniref:Uncharacterized protein n=1 Tax=Cannabis sativa TaxID=3483 RepID=A0A7J6FCQ8_CANSA|nr:hypothetical protein F8388_018597 [Cannabis sativa]KAF4397217.1 hypothetical protein G4B88_009063 [Cannabis sativa]
MEYSASIDKLLVFLLLMFVPNVTYIYISYCPIFEGIFHFRPPDIVYLKEKQLGDLDLTTNSHHHLFAKIVRKF